MIEPWILTPWAWALHYSGASNPSGPWYGWWSGFFGDVTIFAGVAFYVRHKNCHVKGCPRVGKAAVEGTPYTVCHKHHPDHDNTKTITVEHVHRLHKLRTRLEGGS